MLHLEWVFSPSNFWKEKFKQGQGSKAPSGHLPIGSSTYWSFIYLPFYLTNLSFALSIFIPYLPFHSVKLSNLLFPPSIFLLSLVFYFSVYYKTYHSFHLPSLYTNLSFAPSTFYPVYFSTKFTYCTYHSLHLDQNINNIKKLQTLSKMVQNCLNSPKWSK